MIYTVNTLRPRQNGRYFADDIFKCIFLNEIAWISLKISLKFVPMVRIYNIPALVQIMAWCRPGDKPLSEPMMVSLLTHICVTRPQWVNDTISYNMTNWLKRFVLNSLFLYTAISIVYSLVIHIHIWDRLWLLNCWWFMFYSHSGRRYSTRWYS